MGSTIVGGCDWGEAFLSSGVPYLEFNDFFIDVDGVDLEVYSDSGHKGFVVEVFGESHQEAGFPDGRVTDKAEFEEVVDVFE